MTGCTIVPIASNKACSGKCKGNACRAAPRVWVVAACEGMISLFEKKNNGILAPIPRGEYAVFASLGEFQKSIDTAEQVQAFDQLVIIGSSNDIAWIHASLPDPATRHIAAEIEYPLLAAWFKQPLPLPNLTHALEGVFHA